MDSAEKGRVQKKSKNGSKAYSWLKMQAKYLFALIWGKKEKISKHLIDTVGIWRVRKKAHTHPSKKHTITSYKIKSK